MAPTEHRGGGFTILELAISLALVCALLAVLIPALSSARVMSGRDRCANNLRQVGPAWAMYLDDHNDEFPYVPVQPAWRYAGVRFSSIDDEPFADTERPLTAYLPPSPPDHIHVLCCPADRGITGASGGIGTGTRTAFRSFGTSYRACAPLLDAQLAGVAGEQRGVRRAEIMTVPSRLIVMGDPIWYEVYESTDRDAVWHRDIDRGNLLFLDGSVKYMQIRPRPQVGPVVFSPVLR